MYSGAARKAYAAKTAWRYERRRPERTLLYQLVAEHYPRFLDLLANNDRSLPKCMQREFENFLKCGILDHGLLRVRCQDCHGDGVYLTDREQPVFRRTAPGIGVELNESVALAHPYQDEPLRLQMQETPRRPEMKIAIPVACRRSVVLRNGQTTDGVSSHAQSLQRMALDEGYP